MYEKFISKSFRLRDVPRPSLMQVVAHLLFSERLCTKVHPQKNCQYPVAPEMPINHQIIPLDNTMRQNREENSKGKS